MSIHVTMPIYWQQSSRKTVLLSMNAYRNWHYRIAAKMKKDMHELLAPAFKDQAPVPSPYRLDIKLFYKNKLSDPSNIVPLIEKVFLDAMQEAGVVKDDTSSSHLGTSWIVAGQDTENPRCEITVTSLTTPHKEGECTCDHKLQGTGAIFYQSLGILQCSVCNGVQRIRKPIL